ncbi:NAD(P)H-hydrate epimerase [Selenomonas ruminantium]|uniref:Bifunctional NAD(P)H-hydrate repair enzyme n=1 Tax=Selenomonas ruminantium TaxID=971 RepID=A0A1M6WKQ8_SELRU|nr:bifunctional ADP-dependent NAD(P)H-hydrate dehydratase/NAD(P)H-hydrate epimerase [Selenomonas ruminantium]SHK94307.1 NAD(P)H-hydrate epimerase [Selenomonas ruminantium]
MKIAICEEMRNIDRAAAEEYGLPELLLMENAGHMVAQAMEHLLGNVAGRNICIMAGSGNNGGDAFAAARYLSNMGAKIKIFLTCEPEHLKTASARMMKVCKQMGIEVHGLDEDRDWNRLHVALKFADGIIDGLLGTGFSGELKKKVLRLIEEVNEAGKKVLAIDIPSGVEADTGKVSTVAIVADMTLTLGLPKVGHLLSPGADMTGQLIVDDIGIPQSLLQDSKIQQNLLDEKMAVTLLPLRGKAVHKGDCGRILVIAGSQGMTGAAALAATSALRAGAGVVTLAVPASLQPILAGQLQEVMVQPVGEPEQTFLGGEKSLNKLLELAQSHDAVLIGPGLGRSMETQELIRMFAAKVNKPLVMDADAIFAFNNQPDDLSKLPQVPVLTPHLGEMAGLLGVSVSELQEALLPIVREAASEYQCILVVKSECTLIVYPDGMAFFSSLGNPGMATAGSGDVLAGTITGLMKQTEGGLAPLAGVYLHGRAGDIVYGEKGEGLLAGDIRDNLPAALKELRQKQMAGR